MQLPPLRPPVTARPCTSAQEAARTLRDERVGCLVVVDEDRRPVGIVTDRDLALHALQEGRDPAQVRIEHCMSAPAVTVSLEATPLECARVLRRHLVRRLPVLDAEGRVAGVVSADDLVPELTAALDWVARTQQRTRNSTQDVRRDAASQDPTSTSQAGSQVFGKE